MKGRHAIDGSLVQVIETETNLTLNAPFTKVEMMYCNRSKVSHIKIDPQFHNPTRLSNLFNFTKGANLLINFRLEPA